MHYVSQVWENVSDNAKDLVRKLLKMNPAERITAGQCLEHPWLAQPPEPIRGANLNTISPFSSAPQPCSPGGAIGANLRTVENLRQLSGSLSESKSGILGSASSSYRVSDKSSLIATIGSISESPPKPFPSPLSKALDYSLEPLRRQAPPLQNGGKGEEGRHLMEDDGVTRLRITLDLVGTEAGIMDSRAAIRGGVGASTFIAACSPAEPSPLGLATESQKGENTCKDGKMDRDELFGDLDAAFVVEEDRKEGSNDANGDLQEDWG